VRDLAKLGALLDALVKQGANMLGGSGFSVADPAPLQDQARAKAMADAKRRAEVYANAAGVALGRLLFISETGGPPVARFEMAMPRMAASAVPVSPGEQEFQVSVTVSYGVK